MEDLSSCARWAQDPDVVHHVMQTTKTLDEEREWLTEVLKSEEQKVFVILNEENSPIGTCGLHFTPTNPLLKDEKGLSIGIMIGEKPAWGKGYGPEAMALLAEHAHHKYHAKRVWLTVDTVHARAIQAYKKAGFKIVREMDAPERIHSGGKQFLMDISFG